MEESIHNDFFYKASQWCIMLVAFLLPVWFLPTTISPVEFNKALMAAVLVYLSFIFYLAHSVRAGKIAFPAHWIFWVIGAILLSWLASSFVSASPAVSQAVWGFGAETTTFFTFLTFFLLAVMVMFLFSDEAALTKLIFSLIMGFAVFLAAVWILSIGGLGKYLGNFLGGAFKNSNFNMIGSWNASGFAAGLLMLLVYPFLLSSAGKLKWFLGVVFAAATLLVLAVNFSLVWVILGFFALMLLSYAVWRRSVFGASIGVPLIILLIALGAFFFGDVIAQYAAPVAPAEIGVNHTATLSIITASLKHNLLLGSGPNSFGYLWDQFKPSAVNSTQFWSVRFTSGSSYLLTILAEVGFLGWALFIIWLVMLWYWCMRAVAMEENPQRETLLFSAFITYSYVLMMWALYSSTYSLAALGFLSSGIILALVKMSGIVRVREYLLFEEGPRGFISAIAAVLFTIVGIGGLYIAGSSYIGQLAYAGGLNAFNLNNLDKAENNFALAARFNGSNDVYQRALSQFYAARAQSFLRDASTPQDVLTSRFKDALDKAVSFGQGAVNAAPRDFTNYLSLGKIYELVIPLRVAGALDMAEKEYDLALQYAPNSPLLWYDKATSYLADYAVSRNQDSLSKAENALSQAVNLKQDYAEAHFLLAQVYDAEGKTKEAIARGESAALLLPNDIGTLFQLGLLYYRSDRLRDAEQVLNRAVSINDNYSNARYFLGLIYDRTNRKQDAISQFEKISSLNPDNGEVKTILYNLKAGKAALAGIAPPAQAPEKRNAAPVTDKNQ